MTNELQTAVDWAIDFDVFDPEFIEDPYPFLHGLRDACPMAYSERHGATFLPTTYDLVAQVAYDTEHFSSRDVGVVPLTTSANPLNAPPITSDPPFHTASRRLILPAFAPNAVAALEPLTRAIAKELVDAIGDAASADAATDYAQHLPVRIIAHMIGIPPEEEARFTDWAIRILQTGQYDPEVGRVAVKEVLAYFGEQLAMRRQERADDLISYLAETTLDGAPLTDRHIIGTCFLLLIAGIDTTWSSIGASLWHLATHADDLARLAADPSMLPTAVEEFLRAYSPVTMARVAKQETEVGGCPVKVGDKVLLAFPAANRDPAVFEAPDEVRIDREHNRHVAFGIGIHRCAGSNLARMELRVAIEEWIKGFPTFRLADDAVVEWTGGQIRGPRRVPVVFA